MKKIILTKTSKYRYDKKLKKFIVRWTVLDDITRSSIHPSLATFSSRLETFNIWPSTDFIRADDLAEAGFFYSGHFDVFTCFSCGGQLTNRQIEGYNVFKSHAYFFPSCKFINHKKGRDFVARCSEKHQGEDSVSKCSVCYDNTRSILFYPCLHLCACEVCSKKLSSCPMCRRLIDNKQKVFLT